MEFCLIDGVYVMGLNLKELANLKSMLLVGGKPERAKMAAKPPIFASFNEKFF